MKGKHFGKMKLLPMIFVLFVLQSGDCNKQGNVKIPACIEEKIDAISQQPKFNPPATVYRYTYQGQSVFLFSSDCCDQYNYVYDKNCNVICAPSGGITGKGDGRCPNFKQMASNETLVWRDER